MQIETPAIRSGDTDDRVKQIISYLFRLSENLNVALETMGSAERTENSIIEYSGSNAVDSDETYNDLRALIANTAKLVTVEADRLETLLNSKITVLSDDWGVFRENIQSNITATAREVVQSYGYDAEIQTLQEASAGFSAYKVHTEGYIRQGFIDLDENNVPIIGIAIGQGLSSTKETINGVEYDKFSSTQSCAFYTADKVSFRVNGQEVAYVSNRKMHIADVDISDTMTINNKWEVTNNTGLVFKWIGG